MAEALDRLSRDLGDVAALYKRMAFAGVKIVTLAEGEISELHVGLKGTMNQLFLKDLGDKTRRGLRGRVEAGKAGGGLCYGYNVVKRNDAGGAPVNGEREINEAEAEVIRRIFREFASGKSPRGIAHDLNAEGVPGPHGGVWIDTTIRGHATRGTGIVNNELYIGKLVWNRLRYIKDPDSGKRVSRVNPKSEWIVKDVPELRIIDDTAWEAAKQRQAALAVEFAPSIHGVRTAAVKRLHRANRPRFLLSGLLKCGVCGGSYAITVNDRYACSNHYRRGTCKNGRTVRRAEIEARVLEGLKSKLVTPEAAAEAIRAFHAERNRLNRERRAAAAADQRIIEGAERKIKELVTVIENGGYHSALSTRLKELEQQKAEAQARLKYLPDDMPDVHPNLADVYRAKIARLTDALAEPATAGEAAEHIRALVGNVMLSPGAKRGEVEAVLNGELGAILTLVEQKTESLTPAVGVRLAVVAGARNHRESYFLPVSI
jgi:site-specific DNA recombinase